MATTVEKVDPTDTVAGTAGELVAQGAVLMRIENETMMAIAVQRPRNEEKVLEAAIKELEMMAKYDPAELLKTYYSIRYNDGTKVEGPSIKAAQNLARRWGNCTNGARMLSEDSDGYNLEGFFIDYETNYRLTRPQRASKWGKKKGQYYLLPPDKAAQAFQAGASKAMRNAILSSIPSLVVSHYYRTSKKLAGAVEKVDQIKAAFAKWEVTVEMLEKYLEAPISQWSNEHLADLRGLYNAISEKQTTVAEAFGGEKDNGNAEPEKPAANDDLMPKTKPVEVKPASEAVIEVKPEEAKKEAAGGSGGALFKK